MRPKAMPAWLGTAVLLAACFLLPGCSSSSASLEERAIPPAGEETPMTEKTVKTEKEWKRILTPEQYRVLRQAGTERAFTGKFNDHYENGTYICGACGTPLFISETKYDHGTGWPSFTAPVEESRVEYREDNSHGMRRTEVRCAACGSHLGHVFDDGPAPTGRHFCINSAALEFQPAEAASNAVPKGAERSEKQGSEEKSSVSNARREIATFAAGCFWGVEDKFRRVKGVLSTRVGYTGGNVKDPTYSLVCSDTTGHAESVEVIFDPAVTSYERLVENFFLFHDPTQVNRQGPDVGTQYRSVIFYRNEQQEKTARRVIEKLEKSGRFDKPIATQLVPASEFYQAEDYHQQYYEKFRK
jgi:peptide methionine sulfoxide reductase msrA/msrB